MPSVTCHTLFGESKEVPVERLNLRASVYGLVEHQGKCLLLKGLHTGKYVLPGGGIEIGERVTAALQREVREETGLSVSVGEFIHFHEDFFYYDPLDVAFHSLMFYYRCTPLTFDLIGDHDPEDDDVIAPRWVALDTITAQDFQTHGALTLRLLTNHD
ncbi:MAG: NUDIX domain-containing protein [Anaerolineae bacterium]|nr:NUDIX domain-containing protein [Anaerolineae bacterium]